MDLHPDFKDLLSALAATSAEYLVVGGWAVGYHAEPRFTKDLDTAESKRASAMHGRVVRSWWCRRAT
jgi:hypothetical protein